MFISLQIFTLQNHHITVSRTPYWQLHAWGIPALNNE